MIYNLSSEDRQRLREKANETREAKKLAGQHLKQDFSDEPHWRMLASQVGFRLAASHIPASEIKYVKRILKHLDKDITWWQDKTGFTKISDFYKENPNYPAYSLQGLILEDYFWELEEVAKNNK